MTGTGVFCRRCRRTLPPSSFYESNRSTCRTCKIEQAAERRRADPARAREAKRLERKRAVLRQELTGYVLARLLPGVDEVFAQLTHDLFDVLDRDAFRDVEEPLLDARRRWSRLFTQAVHLAEDDLGLEPGSALELLASILRGGEATGFPALGNERRSA